MFIKDIRKGDRFSESAYGMTIYYEAKDDAYFVKEGTKEGWECIGLIIIDGKVTQHTVQLFQNSKYPSYVSIIEKVEK